MNFFDIFHDDMVQHCAIFEPCVRFQKNNPGISRGLSVKNCFFGHFLGKATINSFDFLHDDRGHHCAISGLGALFQKNNPGISRGLSVQKLNFLTFSLKRYYEFFYTLHDDLATFGLGVQFL